MNKWRRVLANFLRNNSDDGKLYVDISKLKVLLIQITNDLIANVAKKLCRICSKTKVKIVGANQRTF